MTLRPELVRLTSGVVAALAILAACGAGDDSGTGPTTPTGPVLSGSPDSGTFAFTDDGGADAGELLAKCDPTNASSCPTGFTCYAQHTSPSWWVDLYGTCTFDCNSQTDALCDSIDGVCGCPVPQGATSASCAGDGGASMVCVPAVKPGTSPGANDGNGGCGTPGCSGGPAVDGAAASPPDDGGDDGGTD